MNRYHDVHMHDACIICTNVVISPEKAEAVDQCPGWIVFAVCGSYDTLSLG